MEDSIYIARMIKEIYSGNVNEDQIEVEAKIDSKTLLEYWIVSTAPSK